MKTKTNSSERAAYRELGIRAVIRKIEAGQSTRDYWPATVRAAWKRIADRGDRHLNGCGALSGPKS